MVRDDWDKRVFSHTNWDDWQLDLHHMSPGCAGGYLAMLLARLDVAGSDAEDAEALRAVRVLVLLVSPVLYASLAAQAVSHRMKGCSSTSVTDTRRSSTPSSKSRATLSSFMRRG